MLPAVGRPGAGPPGVKALGRALRVAVPRKHPPIVQVVVGRWALWALLLLAWGVHWRTFGLEELGQDGYLSVDLGAGSLAHMLTFVARDVHPPLFFALLHGLFALGGLAYPVAKWLPVAASQLTLPVMFVLARRLAGPTVAWWATALLALSVPFLLLTPTVRPFTLGLLASLLSLLLTVRLLQASGRATRGQALALALVTAAALLTWYLQLFVVALEAELFRQAGKRSCGAVGTRRAGLTALAVGTLLALPWYGFVLPGLLAKMRRGATVTEGTPALPTVHTVIAGLTQALLGRSGGVFATIALAGWLLALALGVWACLSPDTPMRRAVGWLRRRLLLLGLLFGVLEVGLILLRWQHPDAAGRYLLGVLPFAVIAQGLALTSRRPSVRLPALLGVTLALGGQLVWFGQLLVIPPHDYEHDAESTFLLAHLRHGDGVLFSDHGRRGQFLLNRSLGPSYPTAVVQTSGDTYLEDTPAQATRRLAALLPRVQRVWYTNTEPRPGRPALGQEALAANAFIVSQQHAGDSDLSLFLTRPPDRRRALGVTLGGAVTLQSAAYTARAAPGGAVTVELDWRDVHPLAAPYSVFVHLDTVHGKLVAQHDGVPAAGLSPTERWQPGEVIADRHGLLLPAGLPAGAYLLHAGIYRVGGNRLTLPDGQNQVELGTVQVGG
jgi:hypothetical protein